MSNDVQWRPYRAFDLIEAGVLPANWQHDVIIIAREHAKRAILDGRSVTSRETQAAVAIPVDVVTGDLIKTYLPWLYKLYETVLCDLASQVADRRLYPSCDAVSAININVLGGINARYESHVDSNPMTGLLFVNTLDDGDGGELLFRDECRDCVVRPCGGVFIAFDARSLTHTVLPLAVDKVRISIPMNYYDSPDAQSRPDDLDRYLYA